MTDDSRLPSLSLIGDHLCSKSAQLNVGKTMPFAPWPSHHHFYRWHKPFPVMGGLLYISTLWLFNIAMENGPFIDDFPMNTSIYKGFAMAMLNNHMVYIYISFYRHDSTNLENHREAAPATRLQLALELATSRVSLPKIRCLGEVVRWPFSKAPSFAWHMEVS